MLQLSAINRFTFIPALCLVLLSLGCRKAPEPPKYTQSTDGPITEYRSDHPPIVWDESKPIVRLAQLGADQLGNPYPKLNRQLRQHDALYLPYEVTTENIAVSENNSVILSELIDVSRLHPDAVAIAMKMESENNTELIKLTLPDILYEELLELTIPVSPGTAKVTAREILSLPQGQTFSDIVVPEKGLLEFSMAYMSSLSAEHYNNEDYTDEALTFMVSVISDAKTHEVYQEKISLDHPDLTDKKTGWVTQQVDLSAYANQTVSIRLSSTVPDEMLVNQDLKRFPIPIWGSPILYSRDPAPKPDKPNVLFISLDTLRADHLGCYGYSRDTSPNIDAFAKDSVLFEDLVATSSWTFPTHASIFTGLSPSVNGDSIRDNEVTRWQLPSAVHSIPEILGDNGYATAAFTQGIVIRGENGFNQGFDTYSDGSLSHSLMPGMAESIFAQAQGWIDAHEGIPFFLFVHSYEIHSPYQAPPPFFGKYGPPEPPVITADNPKLTKADAQIMIDRYDEGIAYTDHILGEFLDELKASGVLDNTVVFIFSDHGEEFFDHGGIAHHKTLYREQLHVPLIIHMPGAEAPKGRVPQQVSQLDFYATVMDALKIDTPVPETSYSLLPLIEQEGKEDEYKRTFAVSELAESHKTRKMIMSIQNEDHKYIVTTEIDNTNSPIHENWTTISQVHDTSLERLLLNGIPASSVDSPGLKQELYNYKTDKAERSNTAPHHSDTLQEMVLLLRHSLDEDQQYTLESDVDSENLTPLSEEEIEALEAAGYL